MSNFGQKEASMGPKMAIIQVFYQTQNLFQIFIEKKLGKYIATDKASLQLLRWTLTPCHDLNILPQKKTQGGISIHNLKQKFY